MLTVLLLYFLLPLYIFVLSYDVEASCLRSAQYNYNAVQENKDGRRAALGCRDRFFFG